MEDTDIDIGPIFNEANDNYRQKFTPTIDTVDDELIRQEQERAFIKARLEKRRQKGQRIDNFNQKYKGGYEELEKQYNALRRDNDPFAMNIEPMYNDRCNYVDILEKGKRRWRRGGCSWKK